MSTTTVMNMATPANLEEFLAELGGIDARRVVNEPTPGTADLDSLAKANGTGKRLCELINGTLVEKAMGYEASIVAAVIARILGMFVAQHRLGLVSGADGLFQLLTSVRGPDVAFVHKDRLPNGRMPNEAYPRLAPNLAVEVLSPGNTKSEMSRKCLEYFHAGVQVVWMVDCVNRSVAVYTAPAKYKILSENDLIDGGVALPGFSCLVSDFFADLDIGLPTE